MVKIKNTYIYVLAFYVTVFSAYMQFMTPKKKKKKEEKKS